MSEAEVTAEDLSRMVAAQGLVPIPEHLMERVVQAVRTHRRAMQRFDQSGIDLRDVVTAQPYRV